MPASRSPIVEVAAATGRIGYWIVLALGNVLVMALEGLVVGIQTTRLMLFEFFVRFLAGQGREFKPLPPPDIAKSPLRRQAQRVHHETELATMPCAALALAPS